MTRGICVSSPGRAQQSSGTITCLMDKVRACDQAKSALREASLYLAQKATPVGCFRHPYACFSAPGASQRSSSVTPVASTCVASWVILTPVTDSLMLQPSSSLGLGTHLSPAWAVDSLAARKLVSEDQWWC